MNLRPVLVCLATLKLTGSATAQDPALDPTAAGPADRVWSADPEDPELWLRRSFALPAGVDSARLVFSCDNECRVLVNGREIAHADSWMDVTVVELHELGPTNVIAVAAENTGGPGAFACWLLWTDDQGTARELVSDASWRVTTAAPGAGWEQAGFDDSEWLAATPSFTTTYGQNLYNGVPSRVHFRSRWSDGAAALAAGLQQLQRASSSTAALRALEAIERAVVAARARIWREREAERQRDAGR